MKVALICMPFAAYDYPSIGISLLQAALRRDKIVCDIYYLNLPFASRIGCKTYYALGILSPTTSLSGDWLFARDLFGADPGRDRAYVEKVLKAEFRHYFGAGTVRRLLEVREEVDHFLDECLDGVPWAKYDVVGFTSSFQQNVASLALAKRVKQAFCAKTIAFGGANCEGEMGVELHRQFPFVEFVCSGEGDRAFPELVRRIASGEDTVGIAGIISRKGTETDAPPEIISPVLDLDSLPYPCYEDYFEQLEKVRLNSDFVPFVPFETSRGCWWGQKMHCVFCGINPASINYRSKTPTRALEELIHLGKTYGKKMLNVDWILDLKYLDSFFPELISRKLNFEFFFETKVNLRKQHLKLLRDAGVFSVQPGIESLSTSVLQILNKGCSCLQNVQFLKWARQYGLDVIWNFLYGVPGECPGEYSEMAKFIPHLRHLPPPSQCGRVRMDRFSPLYMHPARYGLTQVRAHQSYSYIYPFGQEALSRLAYYFDFNFPKERTPAEYTHPTLEKLNEWRFAKYRGELRGIICRHTLTIVDTRTKQRKTTTLREPLRSAYIFCDQIQPLASIRTHLVSCVPEITSTDPALEQALDDLVARGLMLREGKSYLSLAILPGAPCEATPRGSSREMHASPSQGPVRLGSSLETAASAS